MSQVMPEPLLISLMGLPVAAYLTWQGRMLENNSIVPKTSVDLLRHPLGEDGDTRLDRATEIGRSLEDRCIVRFIAAKRDTCQCSTATPLTCRVLLAHTDHILGYSF
jgi:hypothetical protein